MTQYLLSIYQPDGGTPPPEVLERVMRDLAALNNEMRAAGVWVFAAGLHPSTTATVVRVREGDILVTDGPYLEGKEHVGGVYVIDAADLDEALAWARRVARVITLPVDVWPFQGGVELGSWSHRRGPGAGPDVPGPQPPGSISDPGGNQRGPQRRADGGRHRLETGPAAVRSAPGRGPESGRGAQSRGRRRRGPRSARRAQRRGRPRSPRLLPVSRGSRRSAPAPGPSRRCGAGVRCGPRPHGQRSGTRIPASLPRRPRARVNAGSVLAGTPVATLSDRCDSPAWVTPG
jgi:hypothetical protein